jgi:hypothetical protein
MHSKGANIRKIPSSTLKDGELLQGIHDGIHRIVKAPARNTPMPVDVFFQVLEDALVKIVLPEPRLINIIEGEDWRTPIMAYLHNYYKPDSKSEQIRMQQCTKDYQIIGYELYKTSVSSPQLYCTSKIKDKEIL